MRQYRGIPIGKTDFVYGWYSEVDEDRAFIISPQASCEQNFGGDYVITGAIEVIPETVGQSTGLKDKNGKEIYEGDIVTGSYGIPPIKVTGVVQYDSSAFVIKTPKHRPKEVTIRTALECLDIQVIGNIHQQEHK